MTATFTAQDVINLTNQYRKESGLPPLRVNPALMSAAQARAADMAKTGIFAHFVATTTADSSPFSFIHNSGYKLKYAGENLAEGFDDATSTFDAWKKSPTHNANLTYKNFSDIGVAVVPGTYKGQPTNYVIQYMGSPQDEPRVTPVPAPVAPRTVAAPKPAAPVAGRTVSDLFTAGSGSGPAFPLQTAHSTPFMLK